MKKIFFCLLTLLISRGILTGKPHQEYADSRAFEASSFQHPNKSAKVVKKVVTSLKKIQLPAFPKAHNPSLLKIDGGFLMSFRCTDESKPWVNYIGLVKLNEELNPVSEPELLNTRFDSNLIPSQSEDARLFSFRGDIYVIYNDNTELENPTNKERRDMHVARLSLVDNHYVLSRPVKLFHKYKYANILWQKNWTPFEWRGFLYLAYSLNPHEIVAPNFETGECDPHHKTHPSLDWQWGELRGGTPALLVDGEYLAFFHSSSLISSSASNGVRMRHYYMGAYTFSAEPPFNITKISVSPILEQKFYVRSNFHIRVVYPGGFAVSGSNIHVAYGKDDRCIRIATIDKNRLKSMLKPVK